MVTTAILAVCASVSFPQEVQTRLAAQTSKDGIAIRWTFTFAGIPERGFNLYRKETGSADFQRVNSTPLTMLSMEDVTREYGKETADGVYEVFADFGGYPIDLNNLKQEKNIDDPFGLGLVNLYLTVDIRRAKAIGYYFLDKDAAIGKTYMYEVRAIDSKGAEKLVAASNSPIEHTGKPNLPKLPKPNFETSEENIRLSWDAIGGYALYHVYKGEDRKMLKRVSEKAILFLETEQPDEKGQKKRNKKVEYVDAKVEIGKIYYYALTLVDGLGVESEQSEIVKVEYADKFAPPPPFGVKAEEKDGKLRISWEPVGVPDLSGYYVYSDDSVEGNVMKMLSSEIVRTNEFFDTPPAGRDRVYWVSSVDKSGNMSVPSNFAVGKIADMKPPARVKGLAASSQPGKVILKWDPIADEDLHSYDVERTYKEDKEWIKVSSDPYKEIFFVDELDKGVPNVLVYRVRAIDTSFNKGEYSDEIEVKLPDVTPPPAPVILDALSSENSVKLRWMIRWQKDVALVRLERAEAREGPWMQVKEFDVKTTEYQDAGLEPGKKYFYSSFAVDAAGNVSERSEVVEAAPKDTTPPSKPQALQGSAKSDRIALSWKPNVEKDLAGYMVFRMKGNVWAQVSNMLAAPAFEDARINRGKKYQYCVAAVDRWGNVSEKSEMVEVEFK